MDDEFCRERLKTVQDLAEKADPVIRKRLLDLARHYERRLAISAKDPQRPALQPRSPQE
jgi:hypothetical protein